MFSFTINNASKMTIFDLLHATLVMFLQTVAHPSALHAGRFNTTLTLGKLSVKCNQPYIFK